MAAPETVPGASKGHSSTGRASRANRHVHSAAKWILDWPLFPSMVMVPIGAFLLLLQGVVKFMRDFRTAVTGVEPEGIEEGGIFSKREET